MILTFYLPKWKFKWALILIKENNWVKLYQNPSKIAGIMVRTKIWPSSVILTLGLPEQIFQMAHLQVMENNCVKLFWNLFTIGEVMVQKIRTDGGTHIHQTVIDNSVLLTARGLDKNISGLEFKHVIIFQTSYNSERIGFIVIYIPFEVNFPEHSNVLITRDSLAWNMRLLGILLIICGSFRSSLRNGRLI